MSADQGQAVGAQQARDELGVRVRQVAASGQVLMLTVNGQPAGALATLEAVQRAGLELAGAWGIREARREWHRVRELAATQGPQAITDRRRPISVLVSPEHAQVLEQGHPVLSAEELRFDGEQVTDQDGRPIPPGIWAFAGGVLRVEPAAGDGGHGPTTAGGAVSG
jgi:hypothetical protein